MVPARIPLRGNSVELVPQNAELHAADLFAAGPIQITIFSSNGNRVKMGVQAPEQLSIWRKDTEAA